MCWTEINFFKLKKKIDLLVQIFSTVPENYDVRGVFVVIRQFEVLKSFPKNCLHSFILVFVHNNVWMELAECVIEWGNHACDSFPVVNAYDQGNLLKIIF